jgi:D-sedoheptulose 7-phosphate isomerase
MDKNKTKVDTTAKAVNETAKDTTAKAVNETAKDTTVKEYRIMKESVTNELDNHINIIKSLSKNLSDTIVNTSKIIIDCYKNGGKVILIGNGGSAADSQHIAAELVGKFKLDRKSLPAIALTTNTSIFTALANDYGYDTVFSRQLESLANDKDVLIAISTSGNSPNILRAVDTAKSKNIKVVGMTGRDGGKLKNMADILINIPSDDTPRIQEGHITVGHIICDLVEKDLFNE